MIIDRVESVKVIVPPNKNIMKRAKIGEDLWIGWEGYRSIIKLYGDNGFIGLGETSRNYNEDQFEKNKQYLKGKDVFSLNFSHPTLGMPHGSSSAAFEMAIFDLAGKTMGVPVYKLLGGKYQDKVAVAYWTGMKTGKDIEREAKRAVDLGYKGFKFKQRPENPMVEQIRSIHKAAPELEIVIDPGGHFKDRDEFLRQALQLGEYNIKCFEDPMPYDVDLYAFLREKLRNPLAVTLGDPKRMIEAIKKGACDCFNLGGDMRTFVRLNHLADAAGMISWHGSGNEIGIQDASYVHAIAATPNCIIPSDVLGYLIRVDDLLIKTFKVENGFAIVPDDPGLGVELDEDAVKKYSV